jgi:hypothetical protein
LSFLIENKKIYQEREISEKVNEPKVYEMLENVEMSSINNLMIITFLNILTYQKRIAIEKYEKIFLDFIFNLLFNEGINLDIFCLRNIEHENEYYALKEFFYCLYGKENQEETAKQYNDMDLKKAINLFQCLGIRLNESYFKKIPSCVFNNNEKLNQLDKIDQMNSYFDFGPKCKFFSMIISRIFQIEKDFIKDIQSKYKKIDSLFSEIKDKMSTEEKEIFEFFKEFSIAEIFEFCSNTHFPNIENDILKIDFNEKFFKKVQVIQSTTDENLYFIV